MLVTPETWKLLRRTTPVRVRWSACGAAHVEPEWRK
jgi:hypothetical protein